MALTKPELIRALQTALELVDRHGETYAPIVDRLIQEVETREKKASARERAAAMLKAFQLES